jgi:vancomycin permeability regulator SanA
VSAPENLSAAQFHRLNVHAAELHKKGLTSKTVAREHAGGFPLDAVQRSMKVVEDSKATADDPFAGL